eukprot:m.404880 g.404880  ORF g.404880 m.404880 type:complete len:60 (-) comp56481_c1_seq4:28-207(-)
MSLLDFLSLLLFVLVLIFGSRRLNPHFFEWYRLIPSTVCLFLPTLAFIDLNHRIDSQAY